MPLTRGVGDTNIITIIITNCIFYGPPVAPLPKKRFSGSHPKTAASKQ